MYFSTDHSALPDKMKFCKISIRMSRDKKFQFSLLKSFSMEKNKIYVSMSGNNCRYPLIVFAPVSHAHIFFATMHGEEIPKEY